MEIIYENNDPEVKELIKLMGVIAAFRCLLAEDKITEEEFDSLVEETKKDFDYDSIIRYFDKKVKEQPSIKKEFDKYYKETDMLRKEVKNNGTKKRSSKERD